MQIFIIVVFFVLLQSDSKYVLWFMAIALPVSIAIPDSRLRSAANRVI